MPELKLPLVVDPSPVPAFSLEQCVLALLLITGLYFPTSTDGEHSALLVLLAFAILLSLLAFLAWKYGIRRGAAMSISLPIMVGLAGCTYFALLTGPVQFDWGVFVKFSALAMVLALDLRRARFGKLVYAVFVAGNLINIACGIAILIGNQWVDQFLPTYYWAFQSYLVPGMVALHKPVLTLGTHATAGFFLYVFFWVSWETYKVRRDRLALFFAISYFVLLLALTSFTAIAFGVLALGQMALWFWKRSPRLLVAVMLSVLTIVFFIARRFWDQIDILSAQTGLGVTAVLNSDISGPLARYGANGSSRPTVAYLFDYPLCPIGFGTPSDLAGGSAALGDSGPIEYLLRGSIPVLLLVYFGLYRFLQLNLPNRTYVLTLFLLIVAFETGFSLLIYVRTLYLLPFFVIYVKQIVPAQASQPDYA